MSKHTTDSLMTRRQVERRVGLSRSAIYSAMRADRFPLPIRVAPGAVRWSAAEVEAWIETRPRARGDKAA